MEANKIYENPYVAVEAFKSKTGIPWPLARTLIETGKDLYEAGYYFVEHSEILRNNLLVLNRSRGAASNFFVFVKAIDKDTIDIFFSNPSKDERILREELILHHKIKSGDVEKIRNNMRAVVEKIKLFSEFKDVNEYWGVLHSHIGEINNERVWDDGITDSTTWFLQSMLWHHDFHALTSHNWTHNEERLNYLSSMLSSANMVFIPGWENTTTIEDRVKSPHILVLCKDIETAMRAKYEFLSKKLDSKGEAVTPVLTGVPGPYTSHLRYLKSLHDNLDAALIIAHPSSKDPGIDLLDPENYEKLKEETMKILFEFADGVEQFNFKEVKSGMAAHASKYKFISQFIKENNFPLSHMVVNWAAGQHARKLGVLTFANQDDHYQPSIDSEVISDYSYGYNSLILKQSTFNYFKSMGRKFNSQEFVYSLINRKMQNCSEEVEFRPVVFLKIKENEDIDFYEGRKKTGMEKFKEWIQSQPGYIWNIAKLQFKYWFGDKRQKKEIRKELEKAKSYNESPA